MIVIKNCRLIPELTEGFDEAKADLVIDGKYICEILPARTASYESAEGRCCRDSLICMPI